MRRFALREIVPLVGKNPSGKFETETEFCDNVEISAAECTHRGITMMQLLSELVYALC